MPDTLVGWQPRDVAPAQLDVSGIGLLVPGKDVEEGGLASPVRSGDAEDVPRLDRQRDAVDGDEPAVRLPDVGAREGHGPR